MRVLSCLYVLEHGAQVSARHGSLLVTKRDGSRTRVPQEALEAVVLLGNSQVTAEALAACVRRGIRVAALRRNGAVRFLVGGPTTGNVHLRVAQVRAAEDPGRRAAIARWLVAGKLENYRRLLQRWSWDADALGQAHLGRLQESVAERIRNLAGVDDGDRLRGIEGDATRSFFKGLAHHLDACSVPFRFSHRTRRPPRDPVNALLSFVYGLVLAEVTGGIEAVGLDPQIGFLHGIRPGRPSLGLDLVEEFRPAIADRFVAGLLSRHMLQPDHFVTTPGQACYLSDEGRRMLLAAYEEHRSALVVHPLLERSVPRATLPSIQAVLLARHLRGDLPAYPPFVMAG